MVQMYGFLYDLNRVTHFINAGLIGLLLSITK